MIWFIWLWVFTQKRDDWSRLGGGRFSCAHFGPFQYNDVSVSVSLVSVSEWISLANQCIFFANAYFGPHLTKLA